eukprot:4491375-Pyramimonas_sp.AAC.1
MHSFPVFPPCPGSLKWLDTVLQTHRIVDAPPCQIGNSVVSCIYIYIYTFRHHPMGGLGRQTIEIRETRLVCF